MKILDKIIVSSTPPTSKNVAWFDGKGIKIPNQGEWKNAGSGDSIPSLMIDVTYEKLVKLRNEGNLIPGAKYRMTDYETTCTWENTQVAGHPFDLVLTALDNKTLDEKCSAIWSERDTDGYFANSNLPAWDVRYCLDNDKVRFGWAKMGGKCLTFDVSPYFSRLTEEKAFLMGKYEYDGQEHYRWDTYIDGYLFYILTPTDSPKGGDLALLYQVGEEAIEVDILSGAYNEIGGKGVIYRLIDEWDNSVPYDFKNIMFSRPLFEGQYDEEGINTFCYTFCSIDYETFNIEDHSTHSAQCYANNFGDYCTDNVFLIFCDALCYSNTIGDYSSWNTFGSNCYGNKLGVDCCNNIFGQICYYNTLEDSCQYNFFGKGCGRNTFGQNCYNNTLAENNNSNFFGALCHHNVLKISNSQEGRGNTFGKDCSYNTFGAACRNNTLGDSCYRISLGDNCDYNTFEHDCESNNLGNNCAYNVFKASCKSNTFGNNCKYNVFLTYCSNNNFGSSCEKNKFGVYCNYNTFDTTCSANVLFANCSRNTFGPTCNSNVLNCECSYNALSQYCSGNQLGVLCKNNTFGKYCLRNKLGSECSYNTFGNSSSNFYMSAVELKPKVQYVILENSETSSKDIQFYTISNVIGTSSAKKTVNVQRNRTYQTYVTTKSDGTVVEYTIDDILNTQSNVPV